MTGDWREELLNAKRLVLDIEIRDDHSLLCVGFAARKDRAFVFPAERREDIQELLSSSAPKCAQNGQFDLHFLRTRCDLEVTNYCDDTIVAWHACYPELAGASQNKKKSSKRTRKGLAFLSSIYTTDAWWKEYDGASDQEMYELCGRDCCITFEIMEHLDKLIDRQGVRQIYEHQMRLIWPCIAMQERGVRIDDEARRDRLRRLEVRAEEIASHNLGLVEQLVGRARDSIRRHNLFWSKNTCRCCRNGTLKKSACWSCAGFDKKPGVKALGTMKLEPCRECDGRGQWETFNFNPNSNDQKKILLYDVFKLSERVKDGKRKADEEALKALLAEAQAKVDKA